MIIQVQNLSIHTHDVIDIPAHIPSTIFILSTFQNKIDI